MSAAVLAAPSAVISDGNTGGRAELSAATSNVWKVLTPGPLPGDKPGETSSASAPLGQLPTRGKSPGLPKTNVASPPVRAFQTRLPFWSRYHWLPRSTPRSVAPSPFQSPATG